MNLLYYFGFSEPSVKKTMEAETGGLTLLFL